MPKHATGQDRLRLEQRDPSQAGKLLRPERLEVHPDEHPDNHSDQYVYIDTHKYFNPHEYFNPHSHIDFHSNAVFHS